MFHQGRILYYIEYVLDETYKYVLGFINYDTYMS